MPDYPTRAELFQIGADAILVRAEARPPGRRITPEEVYTEGSDINLVLNGATAMAHEVLYQSQRRVKALLLDGAEGEDLDRLVADRWSPTLVRKQASPSVVPLTFTRAAGPLAGQTYVVGTRFKTDTGIEFELTAAATLAPGSNGPVTAAARATTTGTATNVAIGTITLPSAPLADPDVVVTNPEPATGGDDTENDARLRARARIFYLSVRRGTVGAIGFGALTVNGIRSASVIEELDTFGYPTGIVDLYVADANGNANSVLATAVVNALFEWRAAGVQVNVTGATPIYQSIVLKLRFQLGIDTAIAFDRARLAVVSAVNQLAPQQTLPISLITEACRRVPGVIVLDDAVQTPAGDVVPAAGEIIKTTLDRIQAAP